MHLDHRFLTSSIQTIWHAISTTTSIHWLLQYHYHTTTMYSSFHWLWNTAFQSNCPNLHSTYYLWSLYFHNTLPSSHYLFWHHIVQPMGYCPLFLYILHFASTRHTGCLGSIECGSSLYSDYSLHLCYLLLQINHPLLCLYNHHFH